MELVIVPFRRDDAGNDVVTFAFRPVTGGSTMDVAIVGIGIHPFGRHDGVSGLRQGVHAARAALADAGVEWRDVQVAFGGSQDGGNADTLVSDLGLTGLPFVNVPNGCATGGAR